MNRVGTMQRDRWIAGLFLASVAAAAAIPFFTLVAAGWALASLALYLSLPGRPAWQRIAAAALIWLPVTLFLLQQGTVVGTDQGRIMEVMAGPDGALGDLLEFAGLWCVPMAAAVALRWRTRERWPLATGLALGSWAAVLMVAPFSSGVRIGDQLIDVSPLLPLVLAMAITLGLLLWLLIDPRPPSGSNMPARTTG